MQRLASTSRRSACRSLPLLLLSAFATAHRGGHGAEPIAESAQFDFLLGLWDVDVVPKVSSLAAALHGRPKLAGRWKAWRLPDGRGIGDELRITDASGNPVAQSQATRTYDAAARRWTVQTLDLMRSRSSTAQAQWQGGEMRTSGSGTTPDGKPTLTRSRFHDIAAERFRVSQDRSTDNGASWDEGVLVMTARRSGAAGSVTAPAR